MRHVFKVVARGYFGDEIRSVTCETLSEAQDVQAVWLTKGKDTAQSVTVYWLDVK